ncbi:hypothetical protein [Bacillus sp. SN10]|uniref:hypothetical protein n=1 Tax=Bacillus sp. SN10 TaxID=2056493 RepID=UPI000C32B346|nr:hypothetical protein [Bacillus sp. SN10]PKJ52627.1 hypothetical protein CWE34_26810 [Bacillus sp. SN10]
MNLNQIYPIGLFEQEIKKKKRIGNTRSGLVIQVGGTESFDSAYHHFFYTSRQSILAGVEGVELIHLCNSASGTKIFQELFQCLILIKKGRFLPAYLDIVMCDGEYKEQIKQAYGQNFIIWEQHREGYRCGLTNSKPPFERKNNAVYILQILQAIEEYIYSNHKLVSKFSQDYMQIVSEKKKSRHGKRRVTQNFKCLSWIKNFL